jgi:Zn-dependent peptidase ImmA (M78 family)
MFRTLTEELQTFVIAREIAHIKLGHQGQIIAKLSAEETLKQKKDATELANKWLSRP